MAGLLDFVYDSKIFIDLYEILEIEIDSKIDEIKMAYIKMAKKHHPDQGGSSEKFQEITNAYEILFNKETRKTYDLYYLKKNMDEFKGDDIIRLRDDFKNFMSSNIKPISKEELDKLYSEIFNENKDSSIGTEELIDRLNDIQIERKNIQIETSDDTLSNFLSQHKDVVNINDVFEYLKYKNSQSFTNSIMVKELGTLDTIPINSTDYSSFIDDNEYFGSSLYSNVIDMNTTQSTDINANLNIDEFIKWKTTKHSDIKLTDVDIDKYLKIREEEQTIIFNEVEKNLESKTKVNEVEKFLKTKHITENINEYHNNSDKLLDDKKKFTKPNIQKSLLPEIIDLNETNKKIKLNYSNSTDIDGVLKFMDDISLTNKQDFCELEKEIGIDKIEKKSDIFTELKSNIDKPKINNIRKREFK